MLDVSMGACVCLFSMCYVQEGVCTQSSWAPPVRASGRHLIVAGHVHSVCRFQLSSPHRHKCERILFPCDVVDFELHGNSERGSKRGGTGKTDRYSFMADEVVINSS